MQACEGKRQEMVDNKLRIGRIKLIWLMGPIGPIGLIGLIGPIGDIGAKWPNRAYRANWRKVGMDGEGYSSGRLRLAQTARARLASRLITASQGKAPEAGRPKWSPKSSATIPLLAM